MIRLFSSTATSWTSQGLGEIGATRCLVTEERNGMYELEMDVPITDKHYSDITLGCLILVKPNPYENPEPFRIYQINRPMKGLVTINAAHISYDLSKIADKPFTATSITQTMTRLKSYAATTCPFTFGTDKSVAANFKVAEPRSIRSLLAGSEGSVLDVYGTGEWKFNGHSCYLYLNRGQNRGVTIRYGKNLTDLKQEENNANVYSKLYPYWADTNGNLVVLPETTLDINANGNGTLVYDMSDRWETAPTMSDLRTAAQAYIDNNDLGTPVVNLTLSFVQVSELIRDAIYLCDTLSVEFPALGVSAQAKVIKTVYDALLDRYDSIEVGSVKKTFAQTIANLQDQSVIGDTGKSVMQAAIDKATALITGNAGKSNLILNDTDSDGIPNELLFLDTMDIDTAVHVWRWNINGLGYSANGYGGPYGLAITGLNEDGYPEGAIVADFITAGTLNADLVKAGSLESTNYVANTTGFSFNLITGEMDLNVTGNIRSITTYYAESFDNEPPVWDVPKAYLFDKDGNALYDADGKRLLAKSAWTTTTPTTSSSAYRWMRNYIVYTDGSDALTAASPMQDYYGRANLVMQASEDENGNPIGVISGLADYIKFSAGQLEIDSPQFSLDTEGNASFAGDLNAATGSFNGSVTATSLTLGTGVTIPYSKVSGTPDLTVYVAKDGTIGNTPASGTTGFVVSSAGLLKASNAIIYGTLYSSAGTIGGWSLSGTQISKETTISGNDYKAAISAPASPISTNRAFFVSKTASGTTTYPFQVTYDGKLTATGADITGSITATSLTLDPGVTIPYSKISSTPDLSVYVAKDGTIGSTPAAGTTGFVVSSAGALKASNAIIYGSLYSSTGTIGGMTLASNAIYNGTNSMSSTTAGVYLGTGGLRIYGSSTNYFNATNAGVVTVKGGSITGATFLSDDGTSVLDNNGLTLRDADTNNNSLHKIEIKLNNSNLPRFVYSYRASTTSSWGTWEPFYMDSSNYTYLQSTFGYITTIQASDVQTGRAVITNLFIKGNDTTSVGTVVNGTSNVTTLANSTPTNISSVSLTKGTWLVVGQFNMPVASGDNCRVYTSLSTASATLAYPAYTNHAAVGSAQSAYASNISRIVEVENTATVYLVANQNSGSSKTLTSSRNTMKAICIA